MKKNIIITHGRRNEEYIPKQKQKKLNERFQNEGFILRSYDATYENTMFEIYEHDDVIEIEELNSGIRFMVFRKEKK